MVSSLSDLQPCAKMIYLPSACNFHFDALARIALQMINFKVEKLEITCLNCMLFLFLHK